jgi:hypothetical protein
MGGPSVQHCRHMYVGKQEQSYLGQSVEQSHGPLFSFLWQKRKQGSRKAKQAQIGGREVQLRTTRPVPPFGGTAAGRNRTKYAVKYGIKRRNNTSKKWGKEGGTMHVKSRHM